MWFTSKLDVSDLGKFGNRFEANGRYKFYKIYVLRTWTDFSECSVLLLLMTFNIFWNEILNL